jgi:hypothetical protein
MHVNLPAPDGDQPPVAPVHVGWRPRAIMALCLVTVGLATVFGLVHLWPSDHNPPGVIGQAFAAPGVTFPEASVVTVTPFRCDAAGEPSSSTEGVEPSQCAHLGVTIDTGVNAGERVTVDAPQAVYQSGVSAGDGVQLVRVPPTNGAPATYTFFDFDRKLPLAALALIFAIVVVAVARLRGVFALAGIGVATLVLVKFMLPALLQGESAFAVGLVGSSAIMFVVIYLAHGLSMRSSTALAGTLIGSLITAFVGARAVQLTQLTGLSGDDTSLLSAVAGNVSLQGLLTCGVIVAGLGILNDVHADRPRPHRVQRLYHRVRVRRGGAPGASADRGLSARSGERLGQRDGRRGDRAYPRQRHRPGARRPGHDRHRGSLRTARPSAPPP